MVRSKGYYPTSVRQRINNLVQKNINFFAKNSKLNDLVLIEKIKADAAIEVALIQKSTEYAKNIFALVTGTVLISYFTHEKSVIKDQKNEIETKEKALVVRLNEQEALAEEFERNSGNHLEIVEKFEKTAAKINVYEKIIIEKDKELETLQKNLEDIKNKNNILNARYCFPYPK